MTEHGGRERNLQGGRGFPSFARSVRDSSLLACFGSSLLLLCATTLPARSCAFVGVGPADSRSSTPTRTGSSSRTTAPRIFPAQGLRGCRRPLSCGRSCQRENEEKHNGRSVGRCWQEGFGQQRRARRQSCLPLSAKARKKDVSGQDKTDAGAATRLEDLNLEGFADLSGGRNTCLKRVDEAGDASDGNPAKGSKIKVQYTMRVLGGAHIGSSRDEGNIEPFEFVLGRWPSEVTHGWDKAVSTMHKGEIATLVCGPQYAFGAKGAPPKIPPNATVETELELVDWLDLAVKYNAVPGKIETEEELRTRWGQELADGTSPMRKEAGIDRKVQEELDKRQESAPENMDHRGKKIYDVKSEEAQKILAQQKVQGYTRDFGYVEKAKYLDLYIPVPKGTRAKDVTCEIHPGRMVVKVTGAGVVAQGEFEGRVALDGCYWLMTDLSLDSPESMASTKGEDVRQGPRKRGDTCVQVFLEKREPFDTMWQNIFASENDGETDDEG